jgi:TolB-like protein/Flp pilus assembly protein TadD
MAPITVTELLRRRVPHVVGIYLAAGWGLLEFTDWAEGRYGLPAALVNAVMASWAVLAPVVTVAAWRLGGSLQTTHALQVKPTNQRSVAVLPFLDLSPDGDNEYLSDGLTDEIILALSKIPRLRVVSRTSTFVYKGTADDVRTIGRRLGASAVLEGSVSRVDDRLRVMAQLISVTDGFHLWSERYDREMIDVLRIQDEIADRVARALRIVLEEGPRPLRRMPTRSVRAYEVYLKGRQFLRERTLRSYGYARDMFDRAVELDPDFALAYAAIAEVVASVATYYPTASTDIAAADETARRALELDPDLAEAHASLGYVLFSAGRLEEAEAAFARALEIDPRLFSAHYLLARARFQGGRFEEAAHHFQAANDIQQDCEAAFFFAQALEAGGRGREAHGAYEEASLVAATHMELNPDDPRAATMRAVALHRCGRTEEGLRWAREALILDPDDAGVRYNVACFYSVAGEQDAALDCLEEAVRQGLGNREWLERDPDLDPLRETPRFKALLGGGE